MRTCECTRTTGTSFPSLDASAVGIWQVINLLHLVLDAPLMILLHLMAHLYGNDSDFMVLTKRGLALGAFCLYYGMYIE